MKTQRCFLILICICMMLTLIASCEKANPVQNTNDLYYYDDSSREKAADCIPYGYNLENQTIGLLYGTFINTTVVGISDSTDIIFSQIYERNKAVEERLNVDIDFIDSLTPDWGDMDELLRKDISSMSDAYQIVMTNNHTTIMANLYNYFHDLNDSRYIDINERWWNKDAILELSPDYYSYRFLYGDINIDYLGSAGTIFYNKDLYEQYISPTKNGDELYEKVIDGTWTLEEFDRILKKCHIEKGGDGTNDILGFAAVDGEPPHFFRESSMIRMYDRDDRGIPYFNFDIEKATALAEKLYSIYYENDSVSINFWTPATHSFSDGTLVFYPSRLYQARSNALRDMKNNFGILPYPKWDEEQDEYVSLIHDSVVTVCCPVSADIDFVNEEVSAVIEALASESYRRVSVPFYEMALKSAYNRDEMSAQMIDIITGQHDTIKCSLKTNFVYSHTYSLNHLPLIHQWLVLGETANFASRYDSLLGSATESLKKLMQDYAKGAI